MSLTMNAILAVVCGLTLVGSVHSHGRLIDPPSRSTLWRYTYLPLIAPYQSIVEANYQDNELFCGGFSHQMGLGGKCGLCGDPWDGVRENEAGGKYAKGIIVKQYPAGSLMHVYVEITAHHKGYFEFRLCNWNDPTAAVNQECFDVNMLTNGPDGSTKWSLPPVANYGDAQVYEIPLKLPDGLECDQCVLQWKYHTGNSWGCDGLDCCVGCGPQEEFYGCADISIGDGPILPPPGFGSPTESTTKPTPTVTSTSTSSTITSSTTGSTKSTTTSSTAGSTKPTTTPTSTLTQSTLTSLEETAICQPNDANLKAGKECDTFFMCSHGTAYEFKCAPGTIFDPDTAICDHSYNVSPPCGTKVVY